MTALIPVAEARGRVLAGVRPLPGEPVAVTDALGRVLAEDVVPPHDVPPFASSAMDGFAVVAGPAGRRLEIVDEARAGLRRGVPWATARRSGSPPVPSCRTARLR